MYVYVHTNTNAKEQTNIQPWAHSQIEIGILNQTCSQDSNWGLQLHTIACQKHVPKREKDLLNSESVFLNLMHDLQPGIPIF